MREKRRAPSPRRRKPRVNVTAENIRRKRKQLSRRRRIAFFRLLLLLLVLMAALVVIGFCSITLYRWGSQLYGEYQTAHEGYLERQAERAPSIDARFDGYTNVLVLGIDEGVGPTNSGYKQADTLLLLSVKNEDGKLRILTIPRDTYVKIPGAPYMNRIGTLYQSGGATQVVQAVDELLGVSIHQYVVIDMKTCAALIDILDGVDVYVESNMDYDDPEAGISIHLKQGYQHLDGEQAMEFLRYRGTDLGDVGRAQRQQKFMQGIYEKLRQPSTIPKLPRIANLLKTRVDTSAEIFDAAHLANVLRRMNREAPETWMLPGSLSPQDDTVYLPDHKEIEEGIKTLFPEATQDEDNADE